LRRTAQRTRCRIRQAPPPSHRRAEAELIAKLLLKVKPEFSNLQIAKTGTAFKASRRFRPSRMKYLLGEFYPDLRSGARLAVWLMGWVLVNIWLKVKAISMSTAALAVV